MTDSICSYHTNVRTISRWWWWCVTGNFTLRKFMVVMDVYGYLETSSLHHPAVTHPPAARCPSWCPPSICCGSDTRRIRTWCLWTRLPSSARCCISSQTSVPTETKQRVGHEARIREEDSSAMFKHTATSHFNHVVFPDRCGKTSGPVITNPIVSISMLSDASKFNSIRRV